MKLRPSIILQTPSGATVELRKHSIGSVRYCAKVTINNTTVVHAYATYADEVLIDQPNLIVNETHIRLLPESILLAIQFLREHGATGK